MAGEVLHADLELFLTSWYRTVLEARNDPYLTGLEVDRVERDSPRILVLRDDGGDDDYLLTGERQVGVTALAGTRENPSDALAIARLVLALAPRIPAPGWDNPVAAVAGRRSPVLVSEPSDRARAYATLTLRITGTPLT